MIRRTSPKQLSFNPQIDLEHLKAYQPELYDNFIKLKFPYGFIPIQCVYHYPKNRIVYCIDTYHSVYYPSNKRFEMGDSKLLPWSDITYDELMHAIYDPNISSVPLRLYQAAIRYTSAPLIQEKIRLKMLDSLI